MQFPETILDEELRRLLEQKGRSVAAEPFPGTTHLRTDLALDSFDLAELTVHLEERTGVDVFQEGVVQTVGEIRQRLQKQP